MQHSASPSISGPSYTGLLAAHSDHITFAIDTVYSATAQCPLRGQPILKGKSYSNQLPGFHQLAVTIPSLHLSYRPPKLLVLVFKHLALLNVTTTFLEFVPKTSHSSRTSIMAMQHFPTCNRAPLHSSQTQQSLLPCTWEREGQATRKEHGEKHDTFISCASIDQHSISD